MATFRLYYERIDWFAEEIEAEDEDEVWQLAPSIRYESDGTFILQTVVEVEST